ncbi:MAG TPA: glycerol-3-phosphate 1-O-acyltransferase PlsY [Gemmatimonadaceae bacterium]|jgi:acyl phosphate:glycerol-3-phosphate acyltransferase|nr:glycerol-3-phosphate 1-O-acyltransferase PlsY [Gemmatimonadaceae bacterium]
MEPAIALVLSYLSGSLPFAAIAGKARGVDLRKHGSGNLGATNVFRVLGWKVGLLVFLADALKGALPVLLLPPRVHSPRDPVVWAIACGIAAIAGHVRPIFLKLRRGGKGVATAAGVFFALAPIPMAITFAVFVGVVFASGYVSLGSLISAVLLPGLLLATQGARSPLFLVSVVVALFVFWTHRANIGRLRRGEEHRFGKRDRA